MSYDAYHNIHTQIYNFKSKSQLFEYKILQITNILSQKFPPLKPNFKFTILKKKKKKPTNITT